MVRSVSLKNENVAESEDMNEKKNWQLIKKLIL